MFSLAEPLCDTGDANHACHEMADGKSSHRLALQHCKLRHRAGCQKKSRVRHAALQYFGSSQAQKFNMLPL